MGLRQGVALSQHSRKVLMKTVLDCLGGGASVPASRDNLNGSRGRSPHLSAFAAD
jgi:hypothetical protein